MGSRLSRISICRVALCRPYTAPHHLSQTSVWKPAPIEHISAIATSIRNRRDRREWMSSRPGFYRKVLEGYRTLARREPERFRVIQTGRCDVERVAASVWKIVEPVSTRIDV